MTLLPEMLPALLRSAASEISSFTTFEKGKVICFLYFFFEEVLDFVNVIF
jgi:hypothetical protein